MCQWLGTEPEGESWLRGRALKVETRAVGSRFCCAEVLDMVDAYVDIRRRRVWTKKVGNAKIVAIPSVRVRKQGPSPKSLSLLTLP